MVKEADKFVVRLKPEQRNRLKARAAADNQTMNEVMVSALDKHLDHGEAFDAMLDLVKVAIQPQGGAFVQIRRDYLRTIVAEMLHEGLDDKSEHMIAALAVLGGDA